MAADSDGCTVKTVVTCEGDLSDPDFPSQLERKLERLRGLIGEKLKVRKLEPWNSVRVTLSIPREAALRLRQLANEGSQQLRALGILSVQVEGDQVISLRLAGSVAAEPQEIILRTTQDGSSSSAPDADSNLSRLLSGSGTAAAETTVPTEKVQFRSPNVVCPPDTIVPKVPMPSAAINATPPSTKAYPGPFPFASMNQAIHSRDGLSASSSFSAPPPPYPGKHPPVTLSSPLLVNLLQNDGATAPKQLQEQENSALSGGNSGSTTSSIKSSVPVYNQGAAPAIRPQNVRPPPGFMQKTISGPAVRPSVLPLPSSQQNSLPISGIPSTVMHISSTNMPQTNALLSSQANTGKTQANLNLPQMKLCVSGGGNAMVAQSNVLTMPQCNPLLPLNSPARQNNVLPNNLVTTNASSSLSSVLSSRPALLSTSLAHNNNNALQQRNMLTPNAVISQPNSVATKVNNVPPPVRTTPAVPRSCPPPYPSSNSRWETQTTGAAAPQLLELTPSLTDLKADDLDQLLPSLECDLASSPLNLPEELTGTAGNRNFLINPLTGELEPQSSSESEAEEPSDVFTDLPSPAAISDEDTNSTIRPDTTDQSDSETRSSHSDSGKHSRLKNSKIRDRGRDSPGLKPTEKIKLRLKLEKSEPVSPAYKVDVSFVNAQQPKKASCVGTVPTSNEELRVPPLHISLRGRNHVVINNKKKAKFNPDGSPAKPKIRKTQEHPKPKKSDSPKESTLNSEQTVLTSSVSAPVNMLLNAETPANKTCTVEGKKIKKSKPIHDQASAANFSNQDPDIAKHKLAIYNSHYKEKLKERRGSDSELAARSNKRYGDGNGLLQNDKKRRLSQTIEPRGTELQPTVLVGSTNTGTVTTLPAHKLRKDKAKIKEGGFKSKEIGRNKVFSKSAVEKSLKQITLPTGEIDMEAKFKQRLLEDPEKGISRTPHRTESLSQTVENKILNETDKVADLVQALSDPPPVKDKPPEPDKCNTPDRKADLTDKQPGRSPNSGAQGEDSGIESMDALSEKSPNQASQSPHAADIQDSLKPKTQVPDILDIEAQLAKMEGLNGQDLNENKHNSQSKFEQCCGLTSALQDSLKQGAVSLTNHSGPPLKEQSPQVEVSLVPLKNNAKEEDLEPLPVRVTPPLYTYSNPDKSRGSESPSLSDSDSNSCPTLLKSKSLLEQLLIDIPDHQNASSPSPPTTARSVRTRASSKLNSPELNSPVIAKQIRAGGPTTAKRKRNESDSSSNSVEDLRNKKPRKCPETGCDLVKQCNRVGDSSSKIAKKNKVLEESSDSDEPLIEKVRKHSNNIVNKPNKLKSTVLAPGLIKNMNTRRSVRTMPALNTRSKGDKILPDADILRRKTRSAVSEGEAKRKKEVK